MLYYFYYALITVLFFILIYKKIKRSIGFQKYSEDLIRFRIGIVVILGGLVLAMSDFTMGSILLSICTTLIGLTLAYVAKRHTVLDKRDDVFFYKTHIAIEVFILSVFFMRLLYRLFILFKVLANTTTDIEVQLDEFKNPYTLSVFFLLLMYYIGFNLFLLNEVKNNNIENSQL